MNISIHDVVSVEITGERVLSDSHSTSRKVVVTSLEPGNEIGERIAVRTELSIYAPLGESPTIEIEDETFSELKAQLEASRQALRNLAAIVFDPDSGMEIEPATRTQINAAIGVVEDDEDEGNEPDSFGYSGGTLVSTPAIDDSLDVDEGFCEDCGYSYANCECRADDEESLREEAAERDRDLRRMMAGCVTNNDSPKDR